MIITMVISRYGMTPNASATAPGMLSPAGKPSILPCTPTRLNAKIQTNPSTPATIIARSIFFSSVMNPRSVKTGS
ncbi:hypothetical protein D3C83_34260 [compost metagenome]